VEGPSVLGEGEMRWTGDETSLSTWTGLATPSGHRALGTAVINRSPQLRPCRILPRQQVETC
jgi:hypothetical protein